MNRILDLKPGHEAVVVERIYTSLAKAIVKERPHLKSEFSLSEDIFGQEEKTLITENPALKEELASARESEREDKNSASKISGGEAQFAVSEQETKLLKVGGWTPLTSALLGLVVISLIILLWMLLVP